MASAPELSTTTWLAVPKARAQARILPSSLAKMNRAAVPLTRKSVDDPLKTTPVGPPSTVTVSGIFTPAAVYRVDLSVPLSDTHQGVVGPATSPHAFTRSESTVGAAPA